LWPLCLCTIFFFILSNKRQDFLIKVTKHKICVLIFCTISASNISHSKNNSAINYNKHILVVIESTRYSFQIFMKFEIFDRFSKNVQTSNFMKIRPVKAEFFHAEGRKEEHTDMTKLEVAICGGF